jgi:hypothetical protein
MFLALSRSSFNTMRIPRYVVNQLPVGTPIRHSNAFIDTGCSLLVRRTDLQDQRSVRVRDPSRGTVTLLALEEREQLLQRGLPFIP